MKKALMDRLPIGLQIDGGWVFISVMCIISGLGFLTGIAESTAVTKVLHPIGLQVWGGVLMVTGIFLCYAAVLRRLALKKLALNVLSIELCVYGGWIATAVPITQTGLTLVLITILVGLAQIRVMAIRRLLNAKER